MIREYTLNHHQICNTRWPIHLIASSTVMTWGSYDPLNNSCYCNFMLYIRYCFMFDPPFDLQPLSDNNLILLPHMCTIRYFLQKSHMFSYLVFPLIVWFVHGISIVWCSAWKVSSIALIYMFTTNLSIYLQWIWRNI